MGFLDFLTGTTNCPKCGTPGAKKEGNQIHCLNPTCEWFDQGILQGMFGGASASPTPPSSGQDARDVAEFGSAAHSSRVAPPGSVTIRYRNFRGQDLTFIADPISVVQKKNHVSVKVVPTGRRVTLARARIQNLSELEAVVPQRVAPGQEWPTPRERQVLGYHMKYGTTSPLYEKIRAKYPKW